MWKWSRAPSSLLSGSATFSKGANVVHWQQFKSVDVRVAVKRSTNLLHVSD